MIGMIILAAVAMNWWAYPELPERMASHWGPGGQVDGWMAKSVCVWVIPAIMVFQTGLFFVILLIDPLRKNIDKFFSYYAGFVIMMNVFLFAVHSWMILWNLNIQIPSNVFMPIGLACLIFYAGIVMSHVKPNWFIGIRTPWTLSNEIVWQKTHKLGGILFRVAAIIILVGAAFPQYAILFVLVPVLSVSAITVLYSLWLGMGGKWRRTKHISIFFIILLVVLACAVVFPHFSLPDVSTPGFAEVVAPLLDAKTVSFRSSSTIQIGDREEKLPAMLCTYQVPSRMRMEMLDEDITIIGNIQADEFQMLTLMPKDKTAMRVEMPLPAAKEMNPDDLYTSYFDMRERIRRAKENGTAELLPEKVIDGRTVIGYRIRETNNEVDSETCLWIDKKTYRLAQTQSIITIGSLKTFATETDFKFEQNVAPDFFSMNIPEGYTLVQSPVDFASIEAPDEKTLVETLRLWTQYTDGVFPPDLTIESYQNFTEKYMEKILDQDPNEFDNDLNTLTSLIKQLASGIVFVQTLPKETDWHYAGKDAVFGDAETPIFWYRPKNVSTYRVIYADLTVRDVVIDQLPEATQ